MEEESESGRDGKRSVHLPLLSFHEKQAVGVHIDRARRLCKALLFLEVGTSTAIIEEMHKVVHTPLTFLQPYLQVGCPSTGQAQNVGRPGFMYT
jgi:hypothetical protein